jgi:hypothetical protein
MADNASHKLAATISARGQKLDETFNDNLRKWRRRYGDETVDRALAEVKAELE